MQVPPGFLHCCAGFLWQTIYLVFHLRHMFSLHLTACNCNAAGSVTLQCNRTTGTCQCKPGMVGHRCDKCAVDTTGEMPQCEVCGECYYQWKSTLEYLTKNVSVEIGKVGNISISGPSKELLKMSHCIC